MNSYIPYRTTITAGDSLRNPNNGVSEALGSMVNFARKFWPKYNGYTFGRYNHGSIVTPIFLALSKTAKGKPTTKLDLVTNVPKGKPNG